MSPNELSQQEIDALLDRAAERARNASSSRRSAAPHAKERDEAPSPSAFESLLDVPVELRVRLGETEMPIEELASLGAGSVVALDRSPGDPVDVLVNGRLFARGEVEVADDRFTVRVTEILAAGTQSATGGAGRSLPGARDASATGPSPIHRAGKEERKQRVRKGAKGKKR